MNKKQSEKVCEWMNNMFIPHRTPRGGVIEIDANMSRADLKYTRDLINKSTVFGIKLSCTLDCQTIVVTGKIQ